MLKKKLGKTALKKIQGIAQKFEKNKQGRRDLPILEQQETNAFTLKSSDDLAQINFGLKNKHN